MKIPYLLILSSHFERLSMNSTFFSPQSWFMRYSPLSSRGFKSSPSPPSLQPLYLSRRPIFFISHPLHLDAVGRRKGRWLKSRRSYSFSTCPMSFSFLIHSRSHRCEGRIKPWSLKDFFLLFIFHWRLILHRTPDESWRSRVFLTAPGMKGSGGKRRLLEPTPSNSSRSFHLIPPFFISLSRPFSLSVQSMYQTRLELLKDLEC
jgi:hypothetical protein